MNNNFVNSGRFGPNQRFNNATPGSSIHSNHGLNKSKLFVGGVPKTITQEQYREYFEKFGELEQSFLVRKRGDSTPHRGFGFIKFKDASITEKVLNDSHKLPGSEKPLTMSYANLKVKKFFVGGLRNNQSTVESLTAYFSEFGEVKEVYLPPGKNFAFIHLADEKEVEQRLNERQHTIDGNVGIRIDLANSDKKDGQNRGPPRGPPGGFPQGPYQQMPPPGYGYPSGPYGYGVPQMTAPAFGYNMYGAQAYQSIPLQSQGYQSQLVSQTVAPQLPTTQTNSAVTITPGYNMYQTPSQTAQPQVTTTTTWNNQTTAYNPTPQAYTTFGPTPGYTCPPVQQTQIQPNTTMGQPQMYGTQLNQQTTPNQQTTQTQQPDASQGQSQQIQTQQAPSYSTQDQTQAQSYGSTEAQTQNYACQTQGYGSQSVQAQNSSTQNYGTDAQSTSYGQYTIPATSKLDNQSNFVQNSTVSTEFPSQQMNYQTIPTASNSTDTPQTTVADGTNNYTQSTQQTTANQGERYQPY